MNSCGVCMMKPSSSRGVRGCLESGGGVEVRAPQSWPFKGGQITKDVNSTGQHPNNVAIHALVLIVHQAVTSIDRQAGVEDPGQVAPGHVVVLSRRGLILGPVVDLEPGQPTTNPDQLQNRQRQQVKRTLTAS